MLDQQQIETTIIAHANGVAIVELGVLELHSGVFFGAQRIERARKALGVFELGDEEQLDAAGARARIRSHGDAAPQGVQQDVVSYARAGTLFECVQACAEVVDAGASENRVGDDAPHDVDGVVGLGTLPGVAEIGSHEDQAGSVRERFEGPAQLGLGDAPPASTPKQRAADDPT